MFTGNYLTCTPRALRMRGVYLELRSLIYAYCVCDKQRMGLLSTRVPKMRGELQQKYRYVDQNPQAFNQNPQAPGSQAI
jgi:hypothetical protein